MRELADLFRRYGPAYRATCQDRMPLSPMAAMEAIEPCRTEAFGGPASQCTACGDLEYRSHSCTHRHGPTCHNDVATPWLENHRAWLLPVPYFLVTLTLPEALRPVARSHQPLLYRLLLQTSAAALHALTLDPTYLGGQSGMVGVLHTWTRDLADHPHVHSLVPGGALSLDASQGLCPPSADGLVPVHARSRLFRGTCKAAVTTAGLLAYVPPQVWTQGWRTHGQPAGTGTEVLASFAPSLRRVAMTNHRFVKLEDGHVTFRVKERTRHGWTHRTLPAEACMRRFLQHVLPTGCITVRSYGILRPRRRTALAHSRTLRAACASQDYAGESGHSRPCQEPPPTPQEARHCRTCGGLLVFLDRLLPQKRRPPSCA